MLNNLSKLYNLSADEVNAGIRNRDFTAEEYICQILERIDKINVKVNALYPLDREGALGNSPFNR